MRPPVKILVVEDNPIVLLGVTHLLTTHGYEVSPVTTGGESLSQVRTFKPDLVLLDVVLPDMSGVDVCREIKATPELRQTFVVLLSARAVSPEGQINGLEAGADAYITRPIENRELLARLQALLRLQQAEAALREVNARLEERVQQRTAELTAANRALHAEVITRQRVEENQRRYADRLRNLHLIDKAILAAESAEAIAEAALERIQHLLPCETACVVELDPDQNRASVLAYLGEGQVRVGGRWPISQDLLRLSATLRSGQAQLIKNSLNLFQAPRPDGPGHGVAWRNIVDLPMLAEDKLIGVLNLATSRESAFTPEQVEIAREVADQLAVAIRDTRLLEQLRGSRENLRSLSLRLLEVQEQERRFIARELHDEIGQMLTGLKLGLDRLRQAGSAEVCAGLASAADTIDELMARARKLSLDLRPQMLDDLGLLTALNWHFKRYTQQTGVPVVFKHSPLGRRLPTVIETAVFRIVQEALTNVARHAQATEATVRLWLNESHLRIQVEDAGVGCDAGQALKAGATGGLSGMRERANLLGGEFLLESSPGDGTRVTVELPWHE